jgi:hypothetical protein
LFCGDNFAGSIAWIECPKLTFSVEHRLVYAVTDTEIIIMIEQDLRTQPKKPGFFTKILRPDPQILADYPVSGTALASRFWCFL